MGGIAKVNSIVLSVSNSSNLAIFGKSFINSSILNDNYIHIHIINISEADKAFLENIKSKTNLFSYSHSNIDFSKVKKENINSYLVFLKYKIFIEFLTQNKKFVIFYLDISSIIRRKLIPPVQDLGIFVKKDYYDDSMKNVSSMFYSSFKGIDYWKIISKMLNKNISDNEITWFFDQQAIHDTYQTSENFERIFCFSREYCDWKCGTYSPIWTLQGYNNYDDLLKNPQVTLFQTSNRKTREEYEITEQNKDYNVKFLDLKTFYESIKIP